nr:hypothetical protein DA06_10595 [Georgenia sp. SUBG003]
MGDPGGLHAPRISWGGMSTSSFFLRVAAMSISVRTPKPCAASASRTAVAAGSNCWSRVTEIP